jgi:hypothetical protein
MREEIAMSQILVIVPCGQRKIWDTQPERGSIAARDVYTGAPFKVNRAYAERFANYWVILSAKYGFIPPDYLISEPYNVTFKKATTNPITVDVLRQQIYAQQLDRFDTLIGLGGQDYRSMVEATFADTSVRRHYPFAGLTLGKAMQAEKRAIAYGQSSFA